MTIKQKAVSIGASAALLGSLLASTVAGTAFAAATMSPTSADNGGGTLIAISGASGITINATVKLECPAGATPINASVTSTSPDGTALTFVTPDVSPYIGLCQVDADPDGTAGPKTDIAGLPGLFVTASAPGPVTLTPTSGKNGTSVTLTAPGQYIASGIPTVSVGGVPATSAIRVNSTTIQFLVPGATDGSTQPCLLSDGSKNVAVTAADSGGVAVVGIPVFTCNPTTPYAMVPTSGPTGSVVQVSGSAGSFDLGTKVCLNVASLDTSAACTAGLLQSPTSVAADGSKITFTIPTTAAASTLYYVGITAGNAGTAGSAGQFTVTTTASGSAVSPSTVAAAGGTVVQVTAPSGVAFSILSNVQFSYAGAVCTNVVYPTSVASAGTSLTFLMPANTALAGTGCTAVPTNGQVAVWVRADGATLPTAANGTVTYAPAASAPIVSSVSPTSGSRAGGNSVTITGSNFVSGAKVAFGTTAALSVTFVSATQLTAVAPTGVGVVPVTVQNPDGQSGQLPNAYTYLDTGYVCGSATALGATKTGPFGTATVVAKVGEYITWKFSCGTAAAGQNLVVLRAVKDSSGVWSAFTPYTSRVADSGGNIYVWYKASSPAWWSMRNQVAGVYSPARQGRWQ